LLVELRIENHRSLRDEQALTLEAGRVGDEDDPRPRTIAGHASALLPVAAIYGANASGKSNLLDAIDWMQEAVQDSHRGWHPDEGVPRDTFAWGESVTRPSLFEVTFIHDGFRHQYGFVADDERFLEEWLYAWPQGRRQVWFEREADRFKFGEHLRGENRLIEEVTRTNALFLSTAAQHRHEQLGPVYRWFDAINAGATDGVPVERWLSSLLSSPKQQATLDATKELLRAADLGIVDLREEATGSGRRHQPRRPGQILLQHRSDSDDAWLPLEHESGGTLRVLELARPFLRALASGGLVVIDELERSLHPLLASRLVQQLNDPKTNPNHAQLVFSTHDTSLLGTAMGEPVLRRDQVWLTEKDPEGATALYPLTDYKPRKAENLERGYLQGRYGAIPFLGDLAGPVE
jgi:predicted ATPase